MPTRFLKWFLYLTVTVFLCALFASAKADQIARHGDKWVRVTNSPCSDPKVVGWLVKRDLNVADFKAGTAHIGADHQVCWIAGPDGVHLIYDDGDAGKLEYNELHSVPEA